MHRRCALPRIRGLRRWAPSGSRLTSSRRSRAPPPASCIIVVHCALCIVHFVKPATGCILLKARPYRCLAHLAQSRRGRADVGRLTRSGTSPCRRPSGRRPVLHADLCLSPAARPESRRHRRASTRRSGSRRSSGKTCPGDTSCCGATRSPCPSCARRTRQPIAGQCPSASASTTWSAVTPTGARCSRRRPHSISEKSARRAQAASLSSRPGRHVPPGLPAAAGIGRAAWIGGPARRRCRRNRALLRRRRAADALRYNRRFA